jgi:hypothetical protein
LVAVENPAVFFAVFALLIFILVSSFVCC